jgi:beta-lactamase regulating signal transducer with metallopeptidase domain
MEDYLQYFIKVILLQSILFGSFWLFNRKSTNFHFNRYFLLAILILPFVIPFAEIQISLPNNQSGQIYTILPLSFVNEAVSNRPDQIAEPIADNFNYWAIAIVIYFAFAIYASVNMMCSYMNIRRLTRNCKHKETTSRGFQLYHVASNVLSFSFLNKIFLSECFPMTQQEKAIIIAHEEYHVAQKHSLDIIISELVRIVFWFNPLLWLLQNKLKENHEFLSDRHTLHLSGQFQYVKLLRNFKWHEMNLQLVNAYSGSDIKNRINMIQMNPKPSKISGVVTLSIVSILTVFLFACKNDLSDLQTSDKSFDENNPKMALDEEINRTVKAMSDFPQDIKDAYISLQSNDPIHRYILGFSIENSQLENPKNKSMIPGLNDVVLVYSRKFTEDEIKTRNLNSNWNGRDQYNAYGVIYKVNRQEYEEYKRGSHSDDEIHDDYDRPASYPGGQAALEKTIKENLLYPESAISQGIEDRVMMSFVINKAGYFVYLNIEKEPSVEDEALRIEFMKAAFKAIKATEGQWNPAEKDGRYVYSRMTLPIEFKLDKK